jgi:hypothetical protein
MPGSEETKWRLNTDHDEAKERADAASPSKEDEKKEELKQTIKIKAEEIGGVT